MKSLNQIFSENVRMYRKAAGMSQEDFAFLVGIHRNTIGPIENGKRNVSLEIVERIALGLNVPATDLLKESD